MATGWATISDGGVHKKYYFEGDGSLVAGCWRDIDTGQGYVAHYYFRPSGAMATGWATIGGESYLFRPSGNMATGFADVTDDAFKRYFDESGRMLTGWQTIGGSAYYFRPSGAMQTGEAVIDGKSYAFSDKGVFVGAMEWVRASDAPEGAPVRCIDGGCPVEDSCPYNCRKLYYDDKNNAWFRGACTRTFSQTDKPTDEEVMRALSTTDYGLCVYHANNDVVDHQVVNMEFEDGATVSFTMNAFNRGGRRIHLYGTKGELEGRMSGETITVYTFADKQTREIPVRSPDETIVSGHGGGDSGIVYELYDYLGDNYTGYTAADIDISVKNHLIGFAAEKSRRMGTVENIDDFFEQYGVSNT
jgi:hypothetical protein